MSIAPIKDVPGSSKPHQVLRAFAVMNGPEFFMRHAGFKLLSAGLRTEVAVADAQALFGISIEQIQGSVLRLAWLCPKL
jgi:hypothetical protein